MDKNGNKTGGRVKNVPNKTSKSLIEKLNELGMDDSLDNPVVWMFKVAHGLIDFESNNIEMSTTDNQGNVVFGRVKADSNQRIMCMKEVAKYTHPQRKAVEHTGDLSVQISEIRETIIDPGA